MLYSDYPPLQTGRLEQIAHYLQLLITLPHCEMRIFAKICVWACVSNHSVLLHYPHCSLEMKT